MLLLKTREFINEKTIYKNTNKNFLILKKKKTQAKTLKNKKIFYFFLLIGKRYKMGKIRMIGIGSIVGWALAHHFYSFLMVNWWAKAHPTTIKCGKFSLQFKLNALLNTLHNLALQFPYLAQIKLKLT